MLISNSNTYRVKDILYDQSIRTSSCTLEIKGKDVGTQLRSYVWKGDDFFLTKENLINSNALSLIYLRIKDDYPDSVWLYDSSEDEVFCMPKIYKYVKYGVTLKHHHEINYNIELESSLYPKRTFTQGELRNVKWYLDSDCLDLILETDIVYNRDSLGFAEDRVTTRTWYNVDNLPNPEVKITYKSYTINQLDQIDEGITRRGNVIKGLQIPILGMMLNTIPDLEPPVIIQMGRDFLKLYQSSFQSFINESHNQIYIDISSANDYWLDNAIDANGTTIRDYVLNEINIWGI
jgi:hypothetical protein